MTYPLVTDNNIVWNITQIWHWGNTLWPAQDVDRRTDKPAGEHIAKTKYSYEQILYKNSQHLTLLTFCEIYLFQFLFFTVWVRTIYIVDKLPTLDLKKKK